jgi:hypothetical protein
MSYRVDRFNGTFLIDVADGTIDTTTDLRFIGKNYAGYGEVQNENFLHLLENFANTNPPPKPISGQIWYDSVLKKIKFYDGTQFKTASGSVAQSTAPAGLTAGDFWFDTSTDQLFAWNGTQFVLVGPETTTDISSTAAVPVVVKDDQPTPVNHSILKINVNDQTLAIVSATSFTLNSTFNPISGFNVIKKGFTLINTDASTGVTSSDHYYWGTSSNALKFDGRPIGDFVLNSQLGSFGDSGFTVGDQNDLRIWIENGDVPIIENQLGAANPSASIVLRIRTGTGPADRRNIAIVDRTALFPGTDNLYDLGKPSARWKGVYSADKFYGNLKGSLFATDDSELVDSSLKRFNGDLYDQTLALRYEYATGRHFGQFIGSFTGNLTGDVIGTASNATSLGGISTDVNATPDTISQRDSSGNLRAVRFIGIADRSDQIRFSNSYISTSVNADPTTVAVRDPSGNLSANVFNGTATAARYADLAEKYLADKEYEVGTVVSIGGVKEITASRSGDRAIGVISANPAFMMNQDLKDGVYVALKGRVPVKVIGPVKKGDRLVSTDIGVSIVSDENRTNVFAIAIESNDLTEIKLVESIII